MEGESDPENPVQLASYDTVGTSNDVSYSAEDHLIPSPKFNLSASGRNWSQWTSLPKPSPNYVEYLTESSTYLPNTTAEYMIGSSYPPLGSFNDVHGVSETERNFFCNDPGKAFGFKSIDSSSSSSDFDIRKRLEFWRLDGGDEAMKGENESSQNLLYAESHGAVDSIGNKHNASWFDPMGMVSAPSFLPKPPKPGCSSSKQISDKTPYSDRNRRQRIADNLKALHELLPNPEEGSQAQAYILDDIIDYVKYLQHQIKELSGSRLQADTNAIPLFFHEGYGHYMNQQTLNEPLEEIMGKLLEEHSAAALLESKGLFLLPKSLGNDLNEAMQVFGGNALV